jgi:hypothetical protein
LFVGNDWAEDHHDVEIVNERGRRLARRRLPEGLDGITGLHALVWCRPAAGVARYARGSDVLAPLGVSAVSAVRVWSEA